MSGDPMIFLGEVHAPSILPVSLGALGGLVSFRVHPLRRTGRIQVGLPAHLINQSGYPFPVLIRGWGWLTPDYTTLPSWQLGDFLVAIEGITLDQAKEMTQLRQEAQQNQPGNSSTETNLAP
jgi:hypothetical protein